ncbi:MAG: flippase-like domain-containing protein [Selenomonadaceae bacterium]|nr:flippase-like domain-containing protein [Selenomonadaceae bacterium]
MNKFQRRLLALILLVVLISGTVIYTTVDINTLKNITEFQTWSVALAIGFIGFGMFFDGSRLMHLVRISNERITRYQAIQVIFGNYFLALLTPGATGGAVAQLMFLRRAGVPTGKAAVLVIVRTLLSIFFLLLCMPFIFLHDEGILPGISNDILIAGALITFLGILFLVWGARRGVLDYVVIWGTKRFSSKKRRRIFAFYRDTKSAISLLLKAPKSMLLVFIESGLNLLCIYAVVPCLLLGLGIVDADWYTVMGRMIFLNMLLYFTPTPGGAGVAEGGFVMLFAESVPAGTVGIIAVCWRLIAEYIPFLIGFYYTIKVFGRDFLNRQLAK